MCCQPKKVENHWTRLTKIWSKLEYSKLILLSPMSCKPANTEFKVSSFQSNKERERKREREKEREREREREGKREREREREKGSKTNIFFASC